MARRQEKTTRTTWSAIMRTPAFKAGVADAKAGRFDPDSYTKTRDQWSYERGWQFARHQARTAGAVPEIVMELGRRVVAFRLQRAAERAYRDGAMR